MMVSLPLSIDFIVIFVLGTPVRESHLTWWFVPFQHKHNKHLGVLYFTCFEFFTLYEYVFESLALC